MLTCRYCHKTYERSKITPDGPYCSFACLYKWADCKEPEIEVKPVMLEPYELIPSKNIVHIRKPVIVNRVLPDGWVEIKKAVVRRDKYTCLRCNRKFASKKLSPHHLMPRNEGGSDDLTNLVTLCFPCHDFVEINNLRSKSAIIGSF